jgi:hypothetical protein
MAGRLWQEIARRRLPHGLLSLRYLLPIRDDRIKLHRTMWWQSRAGKPLPLWLLLEIWLWVRWLGFGAWRSTWIAVRHYGPAIRQSEGIPLRRQASQAIAIALGWCIPASYLYRYALYKHPGSTLDYVFDHETASYHRWRSRALGFGKASLALLQDKWQQTETLARLGVPMAPILAKVHRNDSDKLYPWLRSDTRLFCKTRSGNRGIGAFSVGCRQGEIAGRTLEGRQLKSLTEVESAWRELLALDDALIQPFLDNHPELARLSDGDDAITLRFISHRHEGRLTCLNATLELPAGWDEQTGCPHYVVLPLDEDGKILPFPQEKLLPPAQETYRRIHARLSGNDVVPQWKTVGAGSFLAHSQFPDICDIAWDWVITPAGPLLLEGNSGWNTEVMQLLNGGLLRQ